MNNILEYDPETKKWKEVGTMEEARYGHAVLPVQYRDFGIYCKRERKSARRPQTTAM